ncbi:DUF2236 domain-containing protein [Arthrobacter gandavensis]|uniref:oxygenase MpaB family protein n=1 Tax=Arthrobacter gandavensis TaxID=169960 RepID=UPI00188FCED4|nr:oxygenase MpaB family protein [Arthrobacter gandavensis]MBF4995044.1 DUF2236 domain-containing protein [Arthrobacter gandavensis]
MTSTARPTDQPRQDDGYFGPGSISWQLYSDPSAKLGGMAALLLQALNPGMMRLFSHVSTAGQDAAARGERTGQYIDTTIFGDRAHADAAARSVRGMHKHANWQDPVGGQTLRAETEDWMDWTHNTLVFAVLRAAEAYGPRLTAQQQDQFVVEQHISAGLVGIDPDRLPATYAELEQYIDGQKDWLALCLPAAEVSRSLRQPSLRGNPVKVWTGIVIQDGILFLLPDWALLLYGVAGRPMSLRGAARTTKAMMAAARRNRPYEDVITALTTKVDTHPYRKVRNRA